MKIILSVTRVTTALLSELRTAFLHFSVFLIVLILPQRMHFSIFRFLARLHPLILDVEQASRNLTEFYQQQPASLTDSARNIALHQLLAYADFYLILFYKDQWLKNNVVINGSLPTQKSHAKGAFFFTLHYGQGVWAYKIMHRQGLPLTRLHAPPPETSPLGHVLADKLGHWRARQLQRFAGCPPITPGGSIEKMRQLLCDEKASIVVMPDAPLRPKQTRIEVRLLDQPSALANGAIDLAVRERVPVYVYTMATDLSTGKRILNMHGPYNLNCKQALAQKIADIASLAIKNDPYAWHLWPWSTHIMQPSQSLPK